MDARGDGTAGPVHGDAPEVAEAEGKRPRVRDGRVVEFVAVLAQVFEKVTTLLPSEALEKFGSGFGNVHAPLRLVVAQTFARRPVVSAEPSVGFHRGAVGMEGEDIRGHRPCLLVARVAVDAVEHGIQVVLSEQPLVFEENVNRGPARRAHGEAVESSVVERRDALADGKVFHHFAEVASKRALPAEGVHATLEMGRDQFMETLHQLDAGVAGREGERSHARCKKGPCKFVAGNAGIDWFVPCLFGLMPTQAR